VTLPGLGDAAVQVYVVVRQRAWMRVSVDGKVEFEGRVTPGSAYPFAGNGRIELLTGNGAGLEVYFNQKNLGVLGGFGEVASRIFTVDGIITPTATITPTPQPPTPTSPVTPTPTGTQAAPGM
jgi:hypothetical protein